MGHNQAVAAARRRILKELKQTNATAAARAHHFAGLSRLERHQLEQLCDRNVIRATGGERFYLDTDALADYQAEVRKWAIIAALVAVILMATVASFAR
jgi:hypothetical protein